MPQDIYSLLSTTPLFEGIDELLLTDILQRTTYHEYPAEYTLIEDRIISQRIIYIIDGMVKVYKVTPQGKEMFLAVENAGDFVGVMDLEKNAGSAIVETLQPTRALVFYKRDLVAFLIKYPFVWERMHAIILAKLKEFKLFHSIRVTNNLSDKIYLMLEFLSRLTNDHSIPISQEDLAQIVGATRPRVTEVLHQLQEQGKIDMSHKKIQFLG